MSTLTAKRKSDRIKMADAVATLARELGATVTVHPERNREIMVSIETARQLNVTVDIDGAGRSTVANTFVLSWHTGLQTDARLSDAFGNINPHHFQKATRVAYDFAGLLATLRRDLGMIADGSAFDAAREAAGIAEHGTWQQRDAQWAAWRAEALAREAGWAISADGTRFHNAEHDATAWADPRQPDAWTSLCAEQHLI